MLATPMRAFVHDVSLGLASLVWCFANFVFVRLSMPGAGNTGACLRLRCVPELGRPAAMHRQQQLFFPAHHYFDTTAPMLTWPLLRPRLHDDILDTGSPTRHRPRHFSHGYLDHGSTTHTLGYLDNGTKGYRLA